MACKCTLLNVAWMRLVFRSTGQSLVAFPQTIMESWVQPKELPRNRKEMEAYNALCSPTLILSEWLKHFVPALDWHSSLVKQLSVYSNTKRIIHIILFIWCQDSICLYISKNSYLPGPPRSHHGILGDASLGPTQKMLGKSDFALSTFRRHLTPKQ